MKKVISVVSLLFLMYAALAQPPLHAKKRVPTFEFNIAVNGFMGNLSEKIATADIKSNYLNSLDARISTPKFTNGNIVGYDGEVNFFFGPQKHFGIGFGVMYSMHQGNASLDTFHIEYQATDFQKQIFRQLIISDGGVTEALKTSNISLPIVGKYKKRLSQRLGLTVDAGVLLCFKTNTSYTANASFDYEAIYQYVKQVDGTYTAVYDNSPTPSLTKDWYITKAQYQASNPTGMTKAFDSLYNEGYNVGLAKPSSKSDGTTSRRVPFTLESIGFIIRPTLSIYASKQLVFNIGGYYMYQPYNYQVKTGYHLTDTLGVYNSLTNTVSSAYTHSYGLTIGVAYYFMEVGAPRKFPKAKR